jgi:hypothetical protein
MRKGHHFGKTESFFRFGSAILKNGVFTENQPNTEKSIFLHRIPIKRVEFRNSVFFSINTSFFNIGAFSILGAFFGNGVSLLEKNSDL